MDRVDERRVLEAAAGARELDAGFGDRRVEIALGRLMVRLREGHDPRVGRGVGKHGTRLVDEIELGQAAAHAEELRALLGIEHVHRFDDERDVAGDARREAPRDRLPVPLVEDPGGDDLHQDERRHDDENGAAEEAARQRPLDEAAVVAPQLARTARRLGQPAAAGDPVLNPA